MGKQYQIRNGVVTEITPQVAALVPDASITAKGIVQLDEAVTDSAVKVPTSAAVKAAFPEKLYDLYVDAVNGDDANDGLTAATAVATLMRADRIYCESHFCAGDFGVRLHIASGTYTDTYDISEVMPKPFLNFKGMILLGASVTFDSEFHPYGSPTFMYIDAEDGTAASFTVTGQFRVGNGAHVYVAEAVTLNVGRLRSCEASYLACAGIVNVIGTGSYSHIQATLGSVFYFYNNVNITLYSSNTSAAIDINTKSMLFGTAACNISINGPCSNALIVDRCCCCYMTGSLSFTGKINNTLLSSFYNSVLYIGQNITAQFTSLGTGSIHVLYSIRHSQIVVAGAVSIALPSGGKVTGFLTAATQASIELLAASAQHTLSGTATLGVAVGRYGGMIRISTSNAFSGTVTGKKYQLESGSSIATGASKLNGSAAGVLDATTFCYAVN